MMATSMIAMAVQLQVDILNARHKMLRCFFDMAVTDTGLSTMCTADELILLPVTVEVLTACRPIVPNELHSNQSMHELNEKKTDMLTNLAAVRSLCVAAVQITRAIARTLKTHNEKKPSTAISAGAG